MDNGEGRGIRANARGKREKRRDGIRAILPQHLQTELNVTKHQIASSTCRSNVWGEWKYNQMR